MTASLRSRDLAPPWVARVQGCFYFVSGLWPLLSVKTFQALTGYKVDFWLAQTVGLVLAVCGVVLILAANAQRITREIALLGASLAAVLMVMDVYCVSQPHTTWVYLLDAVGEAAFVAAWLGSGALRSQTVP